jgi:hypothetical protein
MQRVLILGAGKYEREQDAEHHDQFQFEGIDHVFDLNGNWFPQGLKEGYDVIKTNHVVEHLHSLTNFMNSAWSILNPSGVLHIITPNAGVNPDLDFCDPTHIRCYRKATFTNYFTPAGISKFGYTDKAWDILDLHTFRTEITDDTIYFLGQPIKRETKIVTNTTITTG